MLGTEGRIYHVREMLTSLQSQRVALQVQQVANGHDLDTVPEQGHTTYQVAYARLDAAERRLALEYADLMPEIEKRLNPPAAE